MKPKNGFIIRPMLGVSRQQIMDHMKKHGLDHREDSSNASSDYRRNVIRQDVMTALKRIDGDAAVRITETMSRVHADEQLIKEYLRSLDVVQDTGDQIRIDINKLAATQDPDAFLFHILSPYGYTGELISQIAASMKSQSGKRFEVSGYVLIRDRDEFILETESTPMPEKVIEAGISEVREPIGLKLEHLDTFSVSADDRIGQFDFDQIRFPLTIRRWKEGDRFTPLGMEGTKKLSDFFVDEKMSLLDKQSAWVLESEGEIIWVMGHRISEKVKITSETTSVLQITMHG